MPEPDLDRFVQAQGRCYSDALAELRTGRKKSHWMWFVFPQLRGLGRSAVTHHYGITSVDEARAYLAHPLLGLRLRECVEALEGLGPTSAEAVLGSTDAMKLRSSLTLFAAAGGGHVFDAALQRWFDGQPDEQTLALLEQGA